MWTHKKLHIMLVGELSWLDWLMAQHTLSEIKKLEKDGKSMIGVLSLGIERDNPFTLVLDGEDEEIYITKFEELLNSYE